MILRKHSTVVSFTSLGIGLALVLLTFRTSAATVSWTAGSGVDTNWSDGANWSGGSGTAGVPAGGDNVIFGNIGNATTIAGISNVVDSTAGNFAGYISTLQYTNNVASSYQNTLIAPGVTLNVTNNTGPFGSVLFVGTPTAGSANISVFASIQGAGATLNVNNTNACISISQSGGSSALATLNLTNLDTFVGNVSTIAIGDALFGIGSVAAQGSLSLAKTNTITTAWVGNHSAPFTIVTTNAIQLGVGNTSTLGGINALFLGLTNGIYTDSIGVGGVKSGGSASSPCLVAFAPGFTNNSPTAYFRGISGNTSRIALWGVGDTATTGSSSAGAFGKVDLSFGTVNALVDTMILARDRNTTAAAESGVFTFTAGNVNINTLMVGDQASPTGGAPCSGAMNVSGSASVLAVNTSLQLGITTLGNGTSTITNNTRGVLSVTNGTVLANNVVVGVGSITNIINLINGSLVVSNTLATNAAGLFTLNCSNATIGLTVAANGSLFGLAQTLNTTGATNLVQLNPVPVIFSSYPQQFPLVKYTVWTGSNTFGLASIPAWAPGVTLVSNGPNKSLDLSLPSDPRPVFTAQPTPYSGNPGDNVTSSFAVTIAAASVTPLGYQWYYTNGVSTNLLTNGPGPSGLSTLTGATSANLQIANARPGDNGGYFVVVTNTFGTNTSSLAQLVISAGAIAPNVSGPGTLTATNGVTTIISDTASGSPLPMVYWQFNGAPLGNGTGPSGGSTISGSASSILTISNPQYPGDQGTYSLIASNSAGLSTNNTILTLIVPPSISMQPANLIVTNTQAASFSVTAAGVPSPTYQWYKNGSPISSAGNASAVTATLAIASVSPTDTASYYVQISNSAGSTNSATVNLTVDSTMATTTLIPANGVTGVCYDTPLYVSFNSAPLLRNAGTIKIYNVTNSTTPVDTINLALNGGNGTQPHSPFSGDSQAFNYYPVIITGTTAAIYPHSGVMTSNQTYYVTIDNGVFTDASGAYFAGIAGSSAWQFTTKVGGPVNTNSLVVAQDYSGDFATVQGAVDSVPAANSTPKLIFIKNGAYVEIVDISGKNNVTFRGQSRSGTLVEYANNANIAPGGTTHARMALKVNSKGIAIENMTVVNTTPQGGSQAEALMIESGASQFILNNAEVDSRQDTVLANVNTSQGYFYNSLIQGNFDYIWGGGNLFITNCEIRTIAGTATPNLSAPRTDNGATGNWPGYSGLLVSNGFSFVSCQLTRQSGVTNCSMSDGNGSPNGLAAWINCNFDTGCYTNALSSAYTTQLLWEYGCSNLDNTIALTSANGPFIGFTQLNNGDPRLLAAKNATNWLNGWVPQLAPNITSQPVNQSVSAGQSASFSVSATGIPDPTYQWLDNGSPIIGANSSTYAIPSAVRTNAGNYSVVVNNGSGSVTSSVAMLAYSGNVAPVANPASYVIPAGYSFKIALSNLSTNWSDADGDPITLTSTISSTNGATVSYDSTYVYYSDANGVNDQVNYTVGDGQGGTGAGVINITVSTNPIAGMPQTINVSGMSATLNFAGIPTYQYEIQRSTNMLNWVTIETTNAPSNGLFQFTDTFTDLSGIPPATAFYRTAQP